MHSRDSLIAHLDALGIEHRSLTHPPLFTVEQSRHWHGALPGLHSKNLFFKDAKDKLWLVTLPAEQPIDLKRLPDFIGSKRLSFGKPELLMEVLGVPPGSVTPFALINDTEKRVTFVLDAGFTRAERVCHHPLANTETISVTPADMTRFFQSIDREPVVVDLAACVASAPSAD